MKKGRPIFERVVDPKLLRTSILPVALILLAFLLQAGHPVRTGPVYARAGVHQATLQVTPQATLTPTLSPELDSNRGQTTGIIVGAIFLMLIIVGGTLLMERSLKEQ